MWYNKSGCSAVTIQTDQDVSMGVQSVKKNKIKKVNLFRIH